MTTERTPPLDVDEPNRWRTPKAFLEQDRLAELLQAETERDTLRQQLAAATEALDIVYGAFLSLRPGHNTGNPWWGQSNGQAAMMQRARQAYEAIAAQEPQPSPQEPS